MDSYGFSQGQAINVVFMRVNRRDTLIYADVRIQKVVIIRASVDVVVVVDYIICAYAK